MSTQSVGKLGEPYTNLPPIYQTQTFNEDAYKQAELKSKYGTLASKRDVRKFDRYMKSDAGVKALESARTTHNAAEHQKWSSSYSDYAAAIAAQSKARMLAAKQGFDNAVKKFDAPVEETPSTPALVLKDAAKWNQVASQYGFKDYNAVAAWQKENGLEADGKFGAASYAKWAQLNPDKVSTVPVIKPRVVTPQTPKTPVTPTEDQTTPLIPEGYVELSRPDGTTFLQKTKSKSATSGATPTAPTTPSTKFSLDAFATDNNLTDFRNFNGKRVVRYDPMGRGDWFIDEEGKTYRADGIGGTLGEYVEATSTKYIPEVQRRFDKLQSMISASYQKQGGTMNRINYFQQGGAAPQQQDMQAQVVALVQAAMQGDQKATQTVNQIMEAAKAGDQQAIQIAQLMEQVIKQMQGQARAAKYGAKLDYLQSLKCGGKAKKKEQGGKVCPACEQAKQTKKPLVTKHQYGGNFYKKWTPGEIRKLQMFLSREDKLGQDAYTGEYDGIMNKETFEAIKAFQRAHKLTDDGMWGFYTDANANGLMDNDTLNRGSYTADYNNKHEQGDLLALPTNFTYTKLSDLSNKDAQAVINYYSAYPELLYSDEPEHAKWRQVFHNSGQAGADFLNQSFGAMSVADRAEVDPKKTTTSHKTAELQSDMAEGNTRAAAQLLPVLASPFAIGGVTSVLAGGAGLAGYTGLAGSMIGAPIGGNVGAKRGRKRGEKKQDELYRDEVAERYGVASAVHDPKRRIAEEEAKGRNVGTLVGGLAGGVGGSIAGAGAEAGYYSLLGQGRANLGYAGTPATAQPSVGMYGTTTPPPVQGVSNMQMLKAGLKPANLSAGRTRLGGTYGIRFNHNGKFYNAGTPASQEVINAANTYYNNPMSPLRVNFGGTTNTGAGAKLGLAYGVNVPAAAGIGAQVAPMGIIVDDAISDTQPNHPVRQQKRADRKEERKEKRQERHKKLVARTAESTTD